MTRPAAQEQKFLCLGSFPTSPMYLFLLLPHALELPLPQRKRSDRSILEYFEHFPPSPSSFPHASLSRVLPFRP